MQHFHLPVGICVSKDLPVLLFLALLLGFVQKLFAWIQFQKHKIQNSFEKSQISFKNSTNLQDKLNTLLWLTTKSHLSHSAIMFFFYIINPYLTTLFGYWSCSFLCVYGLCKEYIHVWAHALLSECKSVQLNKYLCPCLYLLTCCLCQLSQTGLVLCQTLLIFSLCPYHPFSYPLCLAVSSPLVVECSLVSNVAKLGEGVSKFQLYCHTFKGKTMT